MSLVPAARKQEGLDAAMVVSLISVAAVAALLAVGALVWRGGAAGLGVALGGMLATVNLWVLALVGRGVLGGGPRGRLWVLVGVLKMVGLFGGAFLLLRAGLVSGFTLVAGYGALPLGITIGTFLRPASASSVPDEKLVPADPDEK
jgi:hypothetical protein